MINLIKNTHLIHCINWTFKGDCTVSLDLCKIQFSNVYMRITFRLRSDALSGCSCVRPGSHFEKRKPIRIREKTEVDKWNENRLLLLRVPIDFRFSVKVWTRPYNGCIQQNTTVLQPFYDSLLRLDHSSWSKSVTQSARRKLPTVAK